MASASVTGCLQKGQEDHGFTLTDSDGKLWELMSKSVNFSDHVGHKVTVSGKHKAAAESQEAKLKQVEMKEAAGKPYGDFWVTKLKMVSESCQ